MCTWILSLLVVGMADPGGPAAGAEGPVGTVRAEGVGRPRPGVTGPRARLLARRAAEVTAVRNLAARLGCRQACTIRGFRYVLTEDLDDGSVRVVVEKQIEPRAPRACDRRAGVPPAAPKRELLREFSSTRVEVRP